MLEDFKLAFPTPSEVASAPLETVAAAVLRNLASRLVRHNDADCWQNFNLRLKDAYGHQGSEMAAQAVAEAWAWLENQGLLVQHSAHGPGWIAISRTGKSALASPDLGKWVHDRDFPQALVHPLLRGSALAAYQQGKFDTAVFEAFKQLEVSIRAAAGLDAGMIGTKLTARAFDPNDGPLTDMSAEPSERQALANLMAGAIGSYKNPQSHRHVGVDGPEAREMIIMASHLLRIVEARQPKPAGARARWQANGGVDI